MELNIKPQGEVNIFVYKKNGELKEKRTHKCKSFTRWAKRYMYGLLRGGNITIRCTDGVDRTLWHGDRYARYYHWRHDIHIGSNNTPFDFDQHALLGKVSLEVTQRISTTGYTEENTTGYWESNKVWTADMAVDIWETGLIGHFIDTGGSGRIFLVTRDVLASAVSLAIDDVIKVVYKIKI